MRTNLFLLAVLVAFSSSISAQNDTYRNDLSLSTGGNIFLPLNLVKFSANDSLVFGDANGFATPTFQLAYDRGFTKWFSLGVAYGYNSFGLSLNNLAISLNGETENIGDFTARFSRHSINLRPLFHYANTGRFDLYSGLRLGFSIWRVKPSADLSDSQWGAVKTLSKVIEKVPAAGGLPQAAITVFGFRGHITENLGIGFEANIGAPYLASVSVDYRF